MPTCRSLLSRVGGRLPTGASRRRLLTILMAVGVTGCAPKVRVALPAGAGTAVADVAPVAQAARASCQAARAVTADLRLSGRIDGERVRGTLQVGLTAETMRLEGLAPFGAPMFVLAARPSEATLYLPRETAVVRGPSAAELLDAVVGVRLSPADLLAIVGGCGVAEWKPTGAATFGDAWTRLDLDGNRRLWLRRVAGTAGGAAAAGPGSLAVVAAEDATWRIEYTRTGTGWPTAIRLQQVAGARNTDAVFAVDAPEAMDALPDGALDIDVPTGTRVVGLADLKKRRDLAER